MFVHSYRNIFLFGEGPDVSAIEFGAFIVTNYSDFDSGFCSSAASFGEDVVREGEYADVKGRLGAIEKFGDFQVVLFVGEENAVFDYGVWTVESVLHEAES